MTLNYEFNKKHLIVYFVVAFFYVAFCFGPNLFADFWFIDDHDFLTNALSFNEGQSYLSMLLSSEVGHWGQAPRFRPAYFLINIFESKIWSLNSGLWYFFRLLILHQLVFVFLILSSRWLGVVLSIGLGICCFAGFYWSDVFSRLGPGEIYASLGLVFLGYGFLLSQNRISSDQLSNKIHLFAKTLIFLGFIIVAGSKEQLTVFVALAAALLYLRGPQGLKSWMLVVVVYCLWILIGVAWSLKVNSMDTNGKSNSIGDRLGVLKGLRISVEFILLCLTTFYFSVRLLIAKKARQKNSQLKFYLIVGLAFIGAFLINFIFYSGRWPAKMRYDFPVAFLHPILISLLLVDIFSFVQNVKWRNVMQIVLVVGLFALAVPSFEQLRLAAHNNVERSRASTQLIDKIIQHHQANPEALVVLEYSSPIMDYEYFFAIQEFLRARRFAGKLAVRVHYDIGKLQNPFEVTLTKNIQKSPLAQVEINQPCFSVFLTGASKTNCEDYGIVVERPEVVMNTNSQYFYF